MTRGILIFAHNSETFDYVKISSIAARLAKKNLGLSVTLVTDADSLTATNDVSVFDNVIVTEKPSTENTRVIDNKVDYFFNFNRYKAYDLTPYDHTLMIDGDLLILTDRLNQYWDVDESFLICERMNDLVGQRLTNNEYRVGDRTIPLRWATAIMFKKDRQSKVIFNMVKKIQKDYRYYFDLYDFKLENFRNDIAFSIAAHIVKGFKDTEINLPPMLFINPTENIFSIDNGTIRLLLDSENKKSMVSIKGADIHVMNKHDILKFEKELCSDI